MWFIDSTGKFRFAKVDSDGHIQIDVLTSPLSALIGEVQASPTTYTVLDRLKILATLLNAGLPSALDTGALKVREQSPITSVNLGNWPSDYPDAGVAKLLGAGLPSALTSDKLKVRASEIETLLGAGLPALLDTASLKVKEQSPLTEIDVDITKILNAAVSLTNYLPVGVVYPAGTLIDPRSIRALTVTDVVTAKQSTASDLKVEIVQPATKETFHVDTSGGTNIVIDKLTQAAYTDRRSTVSNNGDTPSWDYSTSLADWWGKLFPRGCRGFINTVDVYCKDNGVAGGTITVYIAPCIGAGYRYSATITIGAGEGAAWRSAALNVMWNCDSILVWIVGSTTDMYYAHDHGDYDAYRSSDGGVTNAHFDARLWIRTILKGQTVGDLPISGVVGLNDRSTYLYSNVTADKQVKASPGRIHTVTINKCTTAGTLTIYDNTAESGTVIATLNLALNMVPVTLTYDVIFLTGLYLGFDATLVADITVSYL